MSEYIVNLDGELGTDLAVACAGAGFAREEIVRCRDCKHHDHGRCWSDQWSTASLMPAYRVMPDGFCAWGERKHFDKFGNLLKGVD